MAVNTSIKAKVFALGNADLRFPIATFFEATAVTGDGSGGEATLSFTFQANTEYILGLEFVWCEKTTGAPADHYSIRFDTLTFAFGGVDQVPPLMEPSIPTQLRQMGGSSGEVRSYRPTGFWSYYRAAGGGTPAILLVGSNVNLITVRGGIWGYVWDRQALRLAPGPLRPGEWAQELP